MEDIYPDIEQTDHMTSTAIAHAPNQKGTTVIICVFSSFGIISLILEIGLIFLILVIFDLNLFHTDSRNFHFF